MMTARKGHTTTEKECCIRSGSKLLSCSQKSHDYSSEARVFTAIEGGQLGCWAESLVGDLKMQKKEDLQGDPRSLVRWWDTLEGPLEMADLER